VTQAADGGARNRSRTDTGGDGDGPAYYVVVTDQNGTVIERIPVQPGQNTSIVGANTVRETPANDSEGT
jgi:hypothetical protein